MNVDNRSFWSFLKTSNVTVSVKPRHEEPCGVFLVKNLIDLGSGRQTAMVEGYLPVRLGRKSPQKSRLSMPRKIGNLDIVYTTKTITPLSHVYQVIGQILRDASTDRIVPDVLAPGDFLVFTKKSCRKGQSMQMSIEALRVMADRSNGKVGYAI